jgi:hypothetical protein
MNTNIEILLDRTAEYLLKYDASEEGQKCAHEIQDYYEYRPNYILGCLDYARKFAHKAQTIDIDEDPNEFISVANKAYHAWASSMKTQNENMKKKLSNNNILKEWYKGPVEQKKVMIYPGCMSSSEASEIAEQEGLEKEWMGAKAWFEGVVESREEFELEEMPAYYDFVCHMDYIEADLYYDFAGDYYFAVLNKLKTENMKKNKIRLTESKLKQIVNESITKVLNEISAGMADRAANAAYKKSKRRLR